MRNAMDVSMIAGQWISVVSGATYIVAFIKEHIEHRTPNRVEERIEQRLDELEHRIETSV